MSTAETVTEISGRGVGLAAVRACVLASGGTISVDSEAHGTCFHFALPLGPLEQVRLAG